MKAKETKDIHELLSPNLLQDNNRARPAAGCRGRDGKQRVYRPAVVKKLDEQFRVVAFDRSSLGA